MEQEEEEVEGNEDWQGESESETEKSHCRSVTDEQQQQQAGGRRSQERRAEVEEHVNECGTSDVGDFQFERISAMEIDKLIPMSVLSRVCVPARVTSRISWSVFFRFLRAFRGFFCW